MFLIKVKRYRIKYYSFLENYWWKNHIFLLVNYFYKNHLSYWIKTKGKKARGWIQSAQPAGLATRRARARFKPDLRPPGVSVSGCARWLPQDTDRWAPPVGSFSYLQPERWRWTPARLPLSSGQSRSGNGSLVPPPTCSWSGRHRRWSGSPATRCPWRKGFGSASN